LNLNESELPHDLDDSGDCGNSEAESSELSGIEMNVEVVEDDTEDGHWGTTMIQRFMSHPFLSCTGQPGCFEPESNLNEKGPPSEGEVIGGTDINVCGLSLDS
jgi:hypothetical protein